MNIDQLVNTVQRNCHISDARHAGNYTMCIFLLKMREYYRWEQDLPYSTTLSQQEVGDWLSEREQCWESIEDRTYEMLQLDQSEIDPFNTDAVNQQLLDQGYVYSSGYGTYSKPHFFLGSLQLQETRDGITVYRSASELARDMDAPPAMLCNNHIFIRLESVRRFIWERIEEWRWKQNPDTPMGRVLQAIGFELDDETVLDRLMDPVAEIMIHHELGEVQAQHQLGAEWEQMLVAVSGRKTEALLRAARDNLADCLSTLPYLLSEADDSSLHFYFANFHGFRKILFPQASEAYRLWIDHDQKQALTRLADSGGNYWQDLCQRALAVYRQQGPEAAADINALFPVDDHITV